MATVSFLWTICLLWAFQSWMCAADQDGIIEKKILIGQRVNLTCQLSSSDFIEWWLIFGSDLSAKITICPDNQASEHDKCEPISTHVSPSYKFHATLHNDTSILSLTATQNEPNIQCRIGDVVQRNYKLISVDPSDIVPNCTVVLPNSDEDGVLSVILSCGNYAGLDVMLTFDGIGLDTPDTPGSSQSVITKTLHLNDFSNIHNASCNAYVTGFNITRSCNYPNIVKTQYNADMTDIIFECDYESNVDWHLFDTDGREEEIKNRSWTREGGRSLLIRDVSERDVGKVVVCQTRGDNFSNQCNGTIIVFAVILEIYEDISKKNSTDLKPGRRADSLIFVPTLLFIALWLITTAAGGVWWYCNPKRNKSQGPDTQLNQSPNSTPNSNGGAGERDTHLVNVGIMGRGDLDTSNTDNSVDNPAFELEEDGTDENGLNRQSNNETHLYFTLEKTTSMESIRSASTTRMDRYEDTNLASLNQPQSSHWQGYETVGESDKGAACSYDLGEYTEVGDHPIGRSLASQSLRPPIHTPGREEIKEDDISRLYGTVNK